MQKLAILTLLMLGVSAAQEIRPGETLDLTLRTPRLPAPGGIGHGWGGGIAAGSEHHPAPALPLRVWIALKEPAESRFVLGDRILCEVTLENSGDKAVTIPWSLDDALRPETSKEADAIGYKGAGLAFYLLDSAGREHSVHSETIHSVRSMPGTLRTIAPGEAVAIRAGFELEFPTGDGYRTFLGGLPEGSAAVRLVARFNVLPYDYSSGLSKNSVPITLARPTR